jgi:hypothetical protein
MQPKERRLQLAKPSHIYVQSAVLFVVTLAFNLSYLARQPHKGSPFISDARQDLLHPPGQVHQEL